MYEWERDFPISLQKTKPSGESTFQFEFSLTEEEIGQFRSEVESNLNGTLPIELTLTPTGTTGFRVKKKGPGATTLSRKAARIAKFVGKRIDFEYIPAVRTADAASEVVEQMVGRALASIVDDPAYRKALKRLEELQVPVLQELSSQITDTLRSFLPKVKRAEVQVSPEKQFRALRRACEIIVDDGTPTLLERKGQGVQSLAALSLLRGARQMSLKGKDLILAIEEPESHLHPEAIHRLKQVIQELSQQHQVILTTHCPLFVDRSNIASNILVTAKRAKPASKIEEIRKLLGVRAADNLMHADIVLVVEGESDRIALMRLLAQSSPRLKNAISANTLVIDPLRGASNLSYKLSELRAGLCRTHVFLDNDQQGIKASQRAIDEGSLLPSERHFAICAGMAESEIEDMYDVTEYAAMISNVHGVNLKDPKFGTSRRWSVRMSECFRHQGKIWDDKICLEIKLRVAELVAQNPANALNQHKRSAFDALVGALDGRLAQC